MSGPAASEGRIPDGPVASMRVAALYDIHGNLPALEAVLADAEVAGVDLFVVGGDFVMGPMPRQTLERLRALGHRARFIRGNTERDLIGGMADNLREPGAWVARAAWVAGQLEPDDRAFVGGLPATLQVEVDGLGLAVCCHATPRRDDEIVTPATPVERVLPALAGVGAKTVICGHTHMQFDRLIGSLRLVNAGSVGMPYEGRAGAYWVLLGPDVELRRTEFDSGEAARRIMATNFPAAADFARTYVLASPDPEDAIRMFETMAQGRCPPP